MGSWSSCLPWIRWRWRTKGVLMAKVAGEGWNLGLLLWRTFLGSSSVLSTGNLISNDHLLFSLPLPLYHSPTFSSRIHQDLQEVTPRRPFLQSQCGLASDYGPSLLDYISYRLKLDLLWPQSERFAEALLIARLVSSSWYPNVFETQQPP